MIALEVGKVQGDGLAEKVANLKNMTHSQVAPLASFCWEFDPAGSMSGMGQVLLVPPGHFVYMVSGYFMGLQWCCGLGDQDVLARIESSISNLITAWPSANAGHYKSFQQLLPKIKDAVGAAAA